MVENRRINISVGIDATRNRSGGAKAHLIGILKQSDPSVHNIEKVHLWSYRELLDMIPDRKWLIKHHSQTFERTLFW